MTVSYIALNFFDLIWKGIAPIQFCDMEKKTRIYHKWHLAQIIISLYDIVFNVQYDNEPLS